MVAGASPAMRHGAVYFHHQKSARTLPRFAPPADGFHFVFWRAYLMAAPLRGARRSSGLQAWRLLFHKQPWI